MFIKKSIVNLLRNKSRTILTVSGIAVGVFSVVIISIIGKIGTYTINSQMESMGLNNIVVSGDKDNVTGLNSSDVENINILENVKKAMPLIYLMGEAEIASKNFECMTWGVDENANEVISLELLHGRLITKNDLNDKRKVCVIDEQIALEAYKRSNIVGKKIKIYANGNIDEFEVVGIVKNGINVLQGMLEGIIPNFIYIPHTTMSENYYQTYFDAVAVKLEGDYDTSYIERDIQNAILKEREYETKIEVENLLKQKNTLEDILSIITKILSGIGSISLFVSGLSIMTVMLMTVKERTREIGIKKSIGAKNSDIMKEFLTEAVLLTLFGGFFGSITALLISFFSSYALNLEFVFDLMQIFIVLVVSALIGLAFGVYPAYKASKLNPVDALRGEF